MNKIISINISGIVFNIDEEAYARLEQYLERLRKHFGKTAGGDEIIGDIEARIAELFRERLNEGKAAITMTDVNEVVGMMGEPGQFDVESEDGSEESENRSRSQSSKKFKRIYRDPNEKVLGGVCSGLGAYFGVDPVWIRLAFVIALLVFGTGLLVYLILWAVIPKARTTAEKLEMRGEKVTIDNIEKKIREEVDRLNDKMQDLGLSSSSTANKVGGVFEKIFKAIGQVLKGLLKVLKTIFSVFGVVVAFAGMILLLSLIVGFPFQFDIQLSTLGQLLIEDPVYYYLGLTGVILVAFIPPILILIWAFKVLLKLNVNRKAIRLPLFWFWIFGIVCLLVVSSHLVRELREEATVTQKVKLEPFEQDTLYIKIDPEYKQLANKRYNRYLTVGGVDMMWYADDSLWVENVMVNLVNNKADQRFVLYEERIAQGSSLKDASQHAKLLPSSVRQEDSVLLLKPGYFQPLDGSCRFTRTEFRLEVPLGKVIILDDETRSMVYSKWFGNSYFKRYDGYTWIMTEEGLQCLDCARTSNFQPKAGEEWNEQTVNRFDEVEVNGVFDIRIVQSDEFTFRSSGYNRAINNMEVTNNNGKLKVSMDEHFWHYFRSMRRNSVLIEIGMPHLSDLELNGVINCMVKDFDEDQMKIDLNGAAKMTFNGRVRELDCDVTSAAELVLIGEGEELRADLTGASRLKAYDFSLKEARFDLVGATHAQVSVSDYLEVNTAGVSRIHYKGDPKVKNGTFGFGEIKRVE